MAALMCHLLWCAEALGTTPSSAGSGAKSAVRCGSVDRRSEFPPTPELHPFPVLHIRRVCSRAQLRPLNSLTEEDSFPLRPNQTFLFYLLQKHRAGRLLLGSDPQVSVTLLFALTYCVCACSVISNSLSSHGL